MATQVKSVGQLPFAGKQAPEEHDLTMDDAPTEVEELAEKLKGVQVAAAAVPSAAARPYGSFTSRIKVRTLTGRELDVEVDLTESVARIKERVEEMEGIPPVQQRLIMGGKQLADAKTARECNVQPGSVIHLVLALRGGGG
ncbi:hypothetical protein ACP70R_019581 [Stipagrostis hirtigluma subsp. patula]